MCDNVTVSAAAARSVKSHQMIASISRSRQQGQPGAARSGREQQGAGRSREEPEAGRRRRREDAGGGRREQEGGSSRKKRKRNGSKTAREQRESIWNRRASPTSICGRGGHNLSNVADFETRLLVLTRSWRKEAGRESVAVIEFS